LVKTGDGPDGAAEPELAGATPAEARRGGGAGGWLFEAIFKRVVKLRVAGSRITSDAG